MSQKLYGFVVCNCVCFCSDGWKYHSWASIKKLTPAGHLVKASVIFTDHEMSLDVNSALMLVLLSCLFSFPLLAFANSLKSPVVPLFKMFYQTACFNREGFSNPLHNN